MVTHAHGQHGLHTHTNEDYATHQQSIEDERFSEEPLTMADVKDIRLTTTRELLDELGTRGENWRGVEPRSRWLVALTDDIEAGLSEEMLNGTREP